MTFHTVILDRRSIEACHRIGGKNVVITRFVNRKCAREGLYKRAALKGKKIYGNNPLYINDSLCKEFHYVGYVIRKMKRSGMIEQYKNKFGVFSIKIGLNDKFIEISHKSDFAKYNLDIENAFAV